LFWCPKSATVTRSSIEEEQIKIKIITCSGENISKGRQREVRFDM